jgi:Mg-chelatase subunit ChlD
MIRISTPEALGALVLLPLLALALRGRGRRVLVALRLVVVALLVASTAGVELMRAVPDLVVMVVADRSDSIGPEGTRLVRAFLDDLRARAGPARRVGLVTFGANAVVEETPNAQPRLALAAQVRTDGTNIAEALGRALAALPDGAGHRIVLLTDGHATQGDLPSVLAAVRGRGVDLAVVPLGPDPSPPEVLIEEVTMPQTVAVGERLPVTVALRATVATTADLRVRANGVLLLSRDLALRPGRTWVDLEVTATQAGVLRIDAAVEASADGEPGNNRAFALGFVSGPPLVYYVAAAPGPLSEVLERQGLTVRRLSPAGLPVSVAELQRTTAVVLDDVPAYLLNASQQSALREYVRLGGGLVVVGGTQSYGIGGYTGTPLEEALPVTMDVRHRLAVPSLAVVIVLDASGSMGGFGTEVPKVELAKETAQAVVDLMGPRDLIGVLAFDQQPRWLVRPTPAADHARILEAVSRITAGGGTVMYPAIRAARDALRQVEAKVKHVIVLSDGQTDPGAFQTLVTGMAAEKITVSTVAIGRDADLEIMRNIAAWGRGRSYTAQDPYSIPQILTAEAMLATRAYVVEEPFVPRTSAAVPWVADLGAIPVLRGYLATAPKPTAQVAVVSHQDDPIVAMWTFGLGRSVAITTDARNRWTAPWLGWSQASRFWSQAVRWVMRRDPEGLDIHAEPAPDGLRIVLDARTPDGTPQVAWEAAVSVVGDTELAGTTLKQTRAGWYEATLPLPPPGTYLLSVSASDGRTPVGRGTLPLTVPYSPELKHVGVNRPVISQMVEAAGARVIASPAEAMAPPRTPARRPQPLWPAFSALALVGFVVELTIRRIPAIEHQVGRVVAAIGAMLRREPSPAQVQEDREYLAADRWRIEDPAEAAARAASMEAAARIYIARLRRQQAGEGSRDEPRGT